MHSPENRERIEKIRAHLGKYVTVINEVAAGKAEQFKLVVKRTENGNAWSKQYDAVTKSPMLGRNTAAVRDAADAFAIARLAAWRFSATNEGDQVERINKAAEEALAAFAQVRTQIEDKALADAIGGLSAVIADFRTVVSRIVALQQQENALVRVQALPLVTEMGEVSDKIVEFAKHQAETAKADALSQSSFVNVLGIGVGALVVVILIGSAIFGMVSIAKPVRRIGEVLSELANGNKSVEIPYTDRGDEVGDAARAAQTFRKGVDEQERLAAEFQKATNEREELTRGMDGAVEQFRTVSQELLASVGDNAKMMMETAQALTAVSGDASTQAVSAAAASEETATNVKTVAAASEELASSIQEIGRQVEQATRPCAPPAQTRNAPQPKSRVLRQPASGSVRGRPDPGDRGADQPARTQRHH